MSSQPLPVGPRRYQGRRRASATGPRERYPAVAFLAVLLTALGVVLLVRGWATGSPEQMVPPPLAASRQATLEWPAPTGGPSGAAPSAQPDPDRASTAAPSTGASTAPTPSTGSTSKTPPPAIPPTVSPPTSPRPVTLTYEAESPLNTRPKQMDVRSLAAASGGKYVGNIGNNKSLRFNGVAASFGGEYTILVYYLSAEPRTGLVRSNGGAWREVRFPPSGGADKVATINVTVDLVVGTNTVEFSQSASVWTADLDRITVTVR